jgi:hypothetical protein
MVWGRFFDNSLGPWFRRTVALAFDVWSWLAPAVLPVALATVQVVFRLSISPLAWTATAAVTAAGGLPIWLRKTGRSDQALLASVVAVAIQFAVFLTIAGRGLGPQYSARDLAAYFNAQGRVPPHVLLVEERVASIAFYLEPELRAALEPGQIEGFRLGRLDELPAAGPGTVVAVAERWLGQTAHCVDLAGVPFEQVGHYRLYKAAPLGQAYLATAGGKPLLASRLSGDRRELQSTIAR